MNFLETLLIMLNAMSPYILLGFLIAGLLHTCVNPNTLARHLSGNGWKPVVKAALFGVPLPLCSCGVLPTAVSLRRSGASKAASTSFLIATPQTGADSISATYAMLGPAFAIIRPVAALITALGGGLLVGHTEKASSADSCDSEKADERPKGWRNRLKGGLKYGLCDMVDSIGLWLVIGLVAAAVITLLVPDDFFMPFKNYSLLTMLVVVVVAVMMYVCATGSIPIAMSLMLKGLSPGTALVLLMAGPAANFASITIVSKTMGKKTAALYLGTIVAGAILFGILIDWFLPDSWFDLSAMSHAHAHGEAFSWFAASCSAILVTLLIMSLIRSVRRHHIHQTIKNETDMEVKVTGMHCPHCRASVEKGIAALNGVESVSVDLTSGIARIEGTVDRATVAETVRALGFDIE